MSGSTTPQASAADTTTTTTSSTTDGGTPQGTATADTTQGTTTAASDTPMSVERAREILRQTKSKGESTHRDPLLDGGDGSGTDPLLDDVDASNDPLFDGLSLDETDETETAGATSPDGEQGSTEGETETEAETESEEETEETSTEEEEHEETETDGEGERETAKKSSNRLRLRLDTMPARDAAVIRLMRDRGISIDEARLELFGEESTTRGATETQRKEREGEGEKETAKPTAAEIERDLIKLEGELEKAGDALDPGKMAKLHNQIRQKDRELAEARAREASVSNRELSERESIELQSLDRVVAQWPDAVTEGSALNKAIAQEVNRLHSKGSKVFEDPEWREIVTASVAGRLGIAPKAATTAKASTETAKPVTTKVQNKTPAAPVKKATPVPKPGAGGYATTSAQPSAQQIQEQIETARRNGDSATLGKLIKQLNKAA